MLRRIIIGALALILAVVGGVLTFVYAKGADQRAMAQLQPAQVLVVAQPIAAGTPAEAIGESLEVREIPTAAVVPGALTSIGDLGGRVTTADLQPGEQLLESRFAMPEEAALSNAVEIPQGMHQLSLLLEPRRVLGGTLQPGDTVGVFVSQDGIGSHIVQHKVLVVDVVGGPTTVVDENGQEVEQGPAGDVLVTLAVPAADAEELVFAAEYSRIYLSLEAPDAPEEGTRVVDPEVIFE